MDDQTIKIRRRSSGWRAANAVAAAVLERIRRPTGARFEVDDELSEIREIKERISIAGAVGKA